MPTPSSSSVVVKSVHAGAVRLALDDYARHLFASKPSVEEIVVFGSFEQGTYAPGSDVDILIVLSESQASVRDRIPDLLPGSFPVPIDLFPYTPAEIETLQPSPILDAAAKSAWRYRRSGT